MAGGERGYTARAATAAVQAGPRRWAGQHAQDVPAVRVRCDIAGQYRQSRPELWCMTPLAPQLPPRHEGCLLYQCFHACAAWQFVSSCLQGILSPGLEPSGCRSGPRSTFVSGWIRGNRTCYSLSNTTVLALRVKLYRSIDHCLRPRCGNLWSQVQNRDRQENDILVDGMWLQCAMHCTLPIVSEIPISGKHVHLSHCALTT